MKKIYPWLDVTKLACAFLIAYMHCYCYDLGGLGLWVRDIVSAVGVPFFFITSGYFFSKGLMSADNQKRYLKRYVNRIIIIYIVWSVVTIPVAWMNLRFAHPDYEVLMKIAYLIRCFLFVGSLGIYWYLLSLICGTPIIFYFHSKHKTKPLYAAAAVLFIIGILYNSGMLNNTPLYTVIHVIFGSERNFLNVGLFYLCIGYLVGQNEKKLPALPVIYACSLAVSLLIDTYLHNISSLRFMQAFSAFSLFNFCRVLKVNLPDTISLKCRSISTAIYLTHFPLILVFDYYLKRGTWVDFFTVTLISIALYEIVRRILPPKMVKSIYG